MDEKTDASLVCLNGHMINNRTHSLPESNKKHCPDCGELTISACPNCDTEIPGAIPKSRPQYAISESNPNPQRELNWPKEPIEPAAHCDNCGKPYPWTEAKIKATEEMIDLLEDISEDEKNKLKADIPDIMHESPRSEVAGMRFKKMLGKVGGATKEILVNVISDVASETIKKNMGL